MGKQALVIGGTGFLGSAIVDQLLLQGWEVSTLGRGNKAAHKAGCEFIQADRSVPGALAEALRGRSFELVVDCAAYHEADAEQAIAAFTERTGHYVFISTDYVYASVSGARYPISEQHPVQEDTAYAQGKLACERLLKAAWESARFPVTVLRPPHIMGAGRTLGCDIAQGRDMELLTKIREGRGLVLTAEGQLLIQPVWNREIGACIAHLAGQPQSWGETFNCTGPEAVTARDYYRLIADYFSVPLVYETVSIEELLRQKPDSVHYIRHRMYDTSRLRQLTGYTPQFKLQDAMAETIEWMQQQ